jgi:Ser/Thr protein kinase RdoA (MazF antagonist)
MPDFSEVLAAYGMSDAHFTLIGAQANAIYRVKHEERLFLGRVHHNGGIGPQEVASELTFLKWLQNEVPFQVQNPLATVEGEWTTACGSNTASLLSWLDGEILNAHTLTTQTAREIGVLLGQMHVAARRFQPPLSWSRPSLEVAHLLSHCFGVGTEGWSAATSYQKDLLQETLSQTEAAETEVGRSRHTCGIIHGDLHSGNIVCLPSGELAPIDFDDMGQGFFVYDIAVAGARMMRLGHYESLRDALLEGYASTAPNEGIGLHLLPVWTATRTASIALWLLGMSQKREDVRQATASLFQDLENQLRSL